jgi:hypothetical protein
MLKYCLKCEPNGQLNLQTDILQDIGLPNALTISMQIFYYMYNTTPMSSSEVSLHLACVDLVTRDYNVTFINTHPPESRMFYANSNDDFVDHPYPTYGDQYCGRPITESPQLKDVTFCEYFSRYIVSKKADKKLPVVGIDLYGNTIYDNNEEFKKKEYLVRFSDYHPKIHIEEFFYNVLLQVQPFTNESELKSRGSYIRRR